MRTALATFLFFGVATWAADPPVKTDAELKEIALKLNKDATNEDAANAKLKEFTKDKVNTPKMVKIAAGVLKEAKSNEKPFRFYPALVLANAARNVKEYDAAEVFFEFCVNTAIKDLKSLKLINLACHSQIDFYMMRKQYKQAIKACERFMADAAEEATPLDHLKVMEKQLRSMARNGDGDAAIEKLTLLLKQKQFRDNVLILAMKPVVLREAGKLDEAAESYQELIKKTDELEDLPEEGKKLFGDSFRYSLSGIYSELNKVDKAAEQLEKLIKDNPEVATYKNDLGFIWADNDLNIEKAEKLIREAVELDLKQRKKAADEGKFDAELAKKANPAYVDSLGWVLYKQKKYDEAIKHLLESAGSDDEESDHIEIWDHVGDCYLALGKKKEALEAFERGLKAEDVTKKDTERRRKMTEKISTLKKELK